MRVDEARQAQSDRDRKERERVVVTWHERSSEERREAVRLLARAVLRMLVRGSRKLMYFIMLRLNR